MRSRRWAWRGWGAGYRRRGRWAIATPHVANASRTQFLLRVSPGRGVRTMPGHAQSCLIYGRARCASLPSPSTVQQPCAAAAGDVARDASSRCWWVVLAVSSLLREAKSGHAAKFGRRPKSRGEGKVKVAPSTPRHTQAHMERLAFSAILRRVRGRLDLANRQVGCERRSCVLD